MNVIRTHSWLESSVIDLLEVVSMRHSAVARRSGDWQYIESPEAHRSTQLALAP
jgi:hypothetical protein